MSTVSSKEVESLVRSDLAVTGPVAGFNIKYDIVGDAKISPTTGVKLKLDEKSLESAEKKSGVSRAPSKSEPKSLSPTSLSSRQQKKSDARYAQFFEKSGVAQSINKGLAKDASLNNSVWPTSPSPLMRNWHRRRLLQLRETFRQISEQKNKTVSVAAESLPQHTWDRQVKNAIENGKTMAAGIPLDRAMKLAGHDPDSLIKPKNLKGAYKRWAHALLPGSFQPDLMGPTRTN